MSDSLFLLDKNYILKQAQQGLRLELQAMLVSKIKQGYYTHYNSLRLSDDTTKMIEAFQPAHLSLFETTCMMCFAASFDTRRVITNWSFYSMAAATMKCTWLTGKRLSWLI